MFANDQQSKSLILPFTQPLAQSQKSDISENIHDHKKSYVLNQLKISGYSVSEANSQYLLIDSSYEDNLMLSNLTQKLLTQEFKSRKGNNFQIPRHLKTMSNPFQTQNLVLCNICFDSTDVMKMRGCEHSFCSSCVKQYLQNKIYIGSVIDIKCPELLCQNKLENDFIKHQLDTETYKKFEKFKRIKEKEHITNGKWCPSPDCENFVMKKNSNTLSCPCGQKFCFLCGNFEHPNQNCQEAQDLLFQQALKNYSIYQCPKCQTNIQKNLGCNHMTCSKCQYEFCWLCKSAYTSRHYDCMNPFSCPGSQGSDREPFKYPRLMMGLQATFKITMYILASPLIAVFCIGVLLYWILILTARYCLLK